MWVLSFFRLKNIIYIVEYRKYPLTWVLVMFFKKVIMKNTPNTFLGHKMWDWYANTVNFYPEVVKVYDFITWVKSSTDTTIQSLFQ